MPSFEPIPFATVEVSAADVGNTVSVDITAAVQQWVNGSLANYGVSLQPAGKLNVALDSKETEGGTPMEIEITSSAPPGPPTCPTGTLLNSYSQVCANVNDITNLFVPGSDYAGLAGLQLAGTTPQSGVSINIDFGDQHGTPSATFGAASGLAGFWNEINPGVTSALIGTDGFSTDVDISVVANRPGHTVLVSADDAERLLNDNFYDAGTWTVDLIGLADGPYTLFVYAPTHTSVSSGIMQINGVAAGELPGSAAGTLVEGVSYAEFPITVSDGALSLSGTTSGSSPSLAGSDGTLDAATETMRKPDLPNLDELRDREALRQGLGGESGAPLLARVPELPAATAAELAVPGGYGAGTRYNLGTHQALEHAVFHTRMFVQPDGINPSEPLELLFTPATNHTDSATEFVGIYASHLEGGWLGIFGRPCSETYPCPDGDTSNGWQAGWTWPFLDSKFACNITDTVDQGGHRQKVMHYANETVKLDEGIPPLWRNAIYLWNYCVDEWDLIWGHEYREDKRDCSVEDCYKWGPILETFGTQSEIDELGYQDTLLFHDGRWSPLAPEETNFVNPVSPWILSHIDPNRSYDVGNRFVPAGSPAAILTDDTYANGVYPDRTAGADTHVAVASWAPKLGFAKFDLSALAGREVDSALLKLGIQRVKAAGSIGLHLVYGEWDEQTLTYNSMPSFEPTPFAIIDVSAADVGNTISVDITDVAQQWISGSLANYGISIQPAGKLNTSLDSKETEGGTAIAIEAVLAD